MALDPDKKKINWPMAKIRHAVFDISDKSPGLKKTSWQINIPLELTTCRLFYEKQVIVLTYDYKKNIMKIKDLFPNTEVVVDPSRTIETVLSMIPKKKVVIIKKRSTK